MVTVPQEYELIESRLISGLGLFKVAYSESYRAYRLFAQVVRFPRTNFNNYKWNPDRSEYAKITWNEDGFVLREDILKYQSQRFEWVVDPIGDTPFASLCLNDQITGYLDYLAPFIPAPPLPDNPGDLIIFGFQKYYFDKILISCRDDTAIAFDLWGIKFDRNCASANSFPDKKPGSPSKLPILPDGQPIGDISPPYDPSTDDDGDTQPASGDAIPTEPCVSIVRGAGINNDCSKATNVGDYTYQGYVQLKPVTVGTGCAGLRVFLDGIDLGAVQTYYPDAIVLSRTGNCVAPP